MTTPSEDTAVARARRPRDRKVQILSAAARQFWELGYNQVSMAAIADAVDIGASALYRHFRGKQDLLVAVLDQTVVQLEHVVDERLDLDSTINALICIALDRREFGILRDRDLAYLPRIDREQLSARLCLVAEKTSSLVATELGPLQIIGTSGATSPDSANNDEAGLRTRALYAVLSSPSQHWADIEIARFAELLREAALATLHAPLSVEATRLSPRAIGAAPQLPASRREAILAAATRLFDQYSYPAVGLNDIGAAAGIAGPSIYNHFANKDDILTAALVRGNESLWLALNHALEAADSVEDALDRVIDSYVIFAIDNPSNIALPISEVVNLPHDRRDFFRRHQHNYVQEWVTLLRRIRPQLSPPEARIVVHAALAVINELVRDHSLRQWSGLGVKTAALAKAVLTPDARRPHQE